MKVLVTGATGFIGSHLVKKLVLQGDRVKILRRRAPGIDLLSGVDVEAVSGDLSDPGAVCRAVRGSEVVFHVAGKVSFWKGDREELQKVNLLGTHNVVEACLKAKVRRLVHTSSISALGFPVPGQIGNEATPFNWKKIDYNITKFEAEREVARGISQGLDAVIVNPAVVFGPGDLHKHAGAMVWQMMKGKIPFYFDGGCCTCDVEDVAQGHLLALERGKTGERYILGGENLSWKELFEKIAHVVHVPPPDRKIPTLLLKTIAHFIEWKGLLLHRRPALTPESIRVSALPCYYSSDKAIKELGYTIRPLAESLEKTYQWYKENR